MAAVVPVVVLVAAAGAAVAVAAGGLDALSLYVAVQVADSE